MSQKKISKWLARKRAENNKYFTVREIGEALDFDENHFQNGRLHRKLKQLYSYGFLDRKVRVGKPVKYRFKKSKILLKWLKEEPGEAEV